MEHLLIGLIVGIVMGLTGGGGALVSIPLFLWLLDASLKEATFLSLIAVILGTAVNLFSVKPIWEKKIITSFVLFGVLGNYVSLPFKPHLSNIAIALVLTIIAVASIWSVWIPQSDKTQKKHGHKLWVLAVTGFTLGILTTITGLGGGVLLIPILIKVFGKSYAEAMPTSLATILLISLFSFMFQLKTGLELISLTEIGSLALGAIAATLLLKTVLKRMDAGKTILVRKLVFTIVTFYAIGSVLINLFVKNRF